MKSVIRWAIKNSPAMNTLLIVSMIIGAASMVVMRREVFPNFALEIVLVSVPFPGATPEEQRDYTESARKSATREVAGQIIRTIGSLNVIDRLAELEVPTLPTSVRYAVLFAARDTRKLINTVVTSALR